MCSNLLLRRMLQSIESFTVLCKTTLALDETSFKNMDKHQICCRLPCEPHNWVLAHPNEVWRSELLPIGNEIFSKLIYNANFEILEAVFKFASSIICTVIHTLILWIGNCLKRNIFICIIKFVSIQKSIYKLSSTVQNYWSCQWAFSSFFLGPWFYSRTSQIFSKKSSITKIWNLHKCKIVLSQQSVSGHSLCQFQRHISNQCAKRYKFSMKMD